MVNVCVDRNLSVCARGYEFTEDELRELDWEIWNSPDGEWDWEFPTANKKDKYDPILMNTIWHEIIGKGNYAPGFRDWCFLFGDKIDDVEKTLLDREDTDEMFDEMDIFEKEMNLHEQLRIPHKDRPDGDSVKTSLQTNKLTTEDTMMVHVTVLKKGENYWTGDSDMGKIYIPLRLVHHVSGNDLMNVKVMGPHVQIPLRAYYIQ
jgi:hypothetical protein